MAKSVETPYGLIYYELLRKSVKNINLRVRDGVVYISAPKRAPEKYIRGLIFENSLKISDSIKKTAEAAEKKRREEAAAEGYFYYLGKKFIVEHIVSDSCRAEFREGAVRVFAPDETLAKEALSRFEGRLAERVFADAFEEVFGLIKEENIPRPTKISIKKMKSRWGSCTPKRGHISLNLTLLKYPEGCLKYVILHELAHLRYLNHGSEFYAFVAKYMSDYKQYERLLKKPYYEVNYE